MAVRPSEAVRAWEFGTAAALLPYTIAAAAATARSDREGNDRHMIVPPDSAGAGATGLRLEARGAELLEANQAVEIRHDTGVDD